MNDRFRMAGVLIKEFSPDPVIFFNLSPPFQRTVFRSEFGSLFYETRIQYRWWSTGPDVRCFWAEFFPEIHPDAAGATGRFTARPVDGGADSDGLHGLREGAGNLGRCIGSDSIRFVIRNVGQGGMSTGRNYGVIEDMVMIRSSTFQLPAGTSDSITVAANALRVYRIVADEAPNNPAGNTQEQFMVWGCHGQNSAIHWGFVNNFSLNNGTSNPHQLCEAVRTSFDPNDISAKAEGVGTQHFILKNSDIEYKIRFQNTGNDTAFVVRILDKLPNELDASTLRIGTASHPFTWRLASNGTLEFLFQNILLPDSTTNEVRSHGFVTYRIATKNNLTDGTTINNQAQIYFDVNAPVATNIYTHTIGENLSTILFTTPQIVDNQYNIKVFPNPMRTEATLQIFPKSGVLENENLNFTLYNTLGQTVKTQTFAGQKLTLTRDGLPQGIYFYGITQDGRVIARGKVEVQ